MDKSSKALVPTRLGKNDPAAATQGKGKRTAPHPLGAGISLYYIVTPGQSQVIGKLALDDRPEVRVIAMDAPDARRPNKLQAEWLIHEATTPFLIGMYGSANPNASFQVSHHPVMATFCDPSANIPFNLEWLREDVARIGEFPWLTLAPAIHRYDALRNAESGSVEAEKAKAQLTKLLGASPVLRTLLPKLHVRPRSGEYQILSWFYSKER
ncbi:MAG: hypothetical protein OEL20_05235 [Sulfuritalea sp.]|nr:hypothetical protein [Sulfuritalea sp.]